MTMSQERFNELDANGGTLTPAEQALGWHYCPEFDFMLTMGEGPGPCPCGIHGDSPLQLTRPEPHGSRDPLDLVVYDPNALVPEMTDEEITAHLIKGKAEADEFDDNLAEEMKAALTVPALPEDTDPIIHQHDGKWWFWDETGMHRHGPYSSYEETKKDLNHYCHVYLGHPEDPS